MQAKAEQSAHQGVLQSKVDSTRAARQATRTELSRHGAAYTSPLNRSVILAFRLGLAETSAIQNANMTRR